MEKDLLIQEKEKLYVELKNILSRQPGPEVAEQLNVYQETLRKKSAQMKNLLSELNMYMFKVKEQQYECERLTKELSDMKKKYFELKKRESLNATRKPSSPAFAVNPSPNQIQYVAGGFKVQQ